MSLTSPDATDVRSQLLNVSSESFGEYTVPPHRILSMTSLQIIRGVANLAGAVGHGDTPNVVLRADPELDTMLDTLTCGDRLRADLPVLLQNQLASLIVKCWTYLVWMHMIETDPAPIGKRLRDQVLWSLMRPFEPTHTTQPEITHLDNRHAKTKIKNGLKLTALLLCHEPLLIKFVSLGNISADAMVSLTQKQLTLETLEVLVQRAQRNPNRITQHNVRSMLLSEVDKEQPASSPAVLTSPVSEERGARELLALTQSATSLSLESSSSSTPSQMDINIDNDASNEHAMMSPTGASSENDRRAIGEEHNVEAEVKVEVEDDEDEEESVSAEDDDDDSSSTEVHSPHPAPTRRPRKRPRRRPSSRSLQSREQVRREVVPLRRKEPPPPAPMKQIPQRSAVDSLQSTTFRAPDDVRGCVEDDTVHDLFCRHHLAWRRNVLKELAMLTPSKLTEMRVQHEPPPTKDIEQLYRELAHRWGSRIQFVAPLQMENGVNLEQALTHVSMEPEAHDSGWQFYKHEALSWKDTSTSVALSANEYDFEDADSALGSTDSRKYWVFASDHKRDESGGNSAHMLALYRLFSGCEQAFFDSETGVHSTLPLGLFLSLGCMLVVVIQTEGSVVYVPSAVANESAHFITTTTDKAAVSVGGNILNPRHVARLVRQHEEDGPDEAVRLEWAADFSGRGEESATETYKIENGGLLLKVPTATTIHDIHTFLAGVEEDDARYQQEYKRQSLIPDLYSTSQACRILSEALDGDKLPSTVVVEQLLVEAGRVDAAETQSILAALTTKAAASNNRMSITTSPHACGARFGCPHHRNGVDSAFHTVHSIKRPPLLLLSPAVDTLHSQEVLIRHVHQGITSGAVMCTSIVPNLDQQQTRITKRRSTNSKQKSTTTGEYEVNKWGGSADDDKLTVSWMQKTLRERGHVHLTDIAASKEKNDPIVSVWQSQVEAMVCALVGEQIASGLLLRHCTHRSPGVHNPSFNTFFSRGKSASITSPHHNEPHRVSAWHLLLRHAKAAASAIHMEVDCSTPISAQSSSSSFFSQDAPAVSTTATSASAAEVSLIFQAMAAKSKLIAGSDHLLDDIDPKDRSRQSTSARDRYASSVSLAFGELTEDSSLKVMQTLGLTSSSRLLDIGSAYGRFCIYAALTAPRGAAVTGIEAGIKRSKLASQYLDELMVEHQTIMVPVRNNIKLIQGDILDHLLELFAHSHVFMFDECFVDSTWHILAHLLSYLAGQLNEVVVSCKPLNECNSDLVPGEHVPLTLSGGKQTFTARVYKVSPRMKHRHAVEVFQSITHGLGLRATRTLRAGQTIMQVVGEVVYNSTFMQLPDVSKRRMYPYLTRMPGLDKQGKRAFLHALDVSRYINSRANTLYTENVMFKRGEEEVYVVAVRDIRRGEELLSDYENWTTDEQLPWLTDKDMSN